MYKAIDAKRAFVVFTSDDPREVGFDGEVQENVAYEESDNLYDWPIGAASPEPTLGVSTSDDSKYRSFNSPNECREVGFAVVPFSFAAFPSWKDYLECEVSCD